MSKPMFRYEGRLIDVDIFLDDNAMLDKQEELCYVEEEINA